MCVLCVDWDVGLMNRVTEAGLERLAGAGCGVGLTALTFGGKHLPCNLWTV